MRLGALAILLKNIKLGTDRMSVGINFYCKIHL
jgi:hypothetical protein